MMPALLKKVITKPTVSNTVNQRSEDVYTVEAAKSTKNEFADAKIPQNPFLGPNNFGSPHCDSYCSESVSLNGPISDQIRVIRQRNPYGYTPCMVCNSNNQMIGISLDMHTARFWLVIFDKNCNIISASKLGLKLQATFGGGYFYMNNLEQTVVVSENKMICFDTANVTAESGCGDTNALTPLWTSDDMVKQITGKVLGNAVYSSLPVWGSDPELYWVLLAGNYDLANETYKDGPAGMAVVRVTPRPNLPSGCVTKVESYVLLDYEWNNNTFAVDECGAYFVTNVVERAGPRKGQNTKGYLRCVSYENGQVVETWKTEYKNCGYLKLGQKNIGSGTTPTLIDSKEGRKMVAITDNDAPRMNVVVCDRKNGALFSETPVFTPMRSADEASLIGVENTLVVENNYGHEFTYPNSQLTAIEPGMSRLSVPQDDTDVQVSWTDHRTSFLAMNMLARGSGIIFAHTADWSDSAAATEGAMYYIVAMDAFTGRRIWQVPVGRGVEFCHDFGGLYFNHEGSLYVGTVSYIVGIQEA